MKQNSPFCLPVNSCVVERRIRQVQFCFGESEKIPAAIAGVVRRMDRSISNFAVPNADVNMRRNDRSARF